MELVLANNRRSDCNWELIRQVQHFILITKLFFNFFYFFDRAAGKLLACLPVYWPGSWNVFRSRRWFIGLATGVYLAVSLVFEQIAVFCRNVSICAGDSRLLTPP